MASSTVRVRSDFRTIRRPRLSTPITEALTAADVPVRVVLMCAPAGSGKTRLLHDCAESLERQNSCRIAAVDVTEGMTLPTFRSAIRSALEESCRGGEEPVWLLLDDAHLLTDRHVLDELSYLLRTST